MRLFSLALLFALGVLCVHPCQADLAAIYGSATDVPITANSISLKGETFSAKLNFAPAVGTNLTVIRNTGPAFINGTYNNLAQGQIVTLNYGGINYRFIANYYGGTGNDLVLQWAHTRPVAWGANTYGQLGDNSVTYRYAPVNLYPAELFVGRTIIAMATGGGQSLALCSDGTLSAWGSGNAGELGNQDARGDRTTPLAVDTTGVLAGKRIVSIAAGSLHSLALCSDGTVAAWGRSDFGQLGNGTTGRSDVPVAVSMSGALAGKMVTAIAGSDHHSLALCSDGTVAAWGYNADGQLGDGTRTQRVTPVAVDTTGVLAGKTVVAIAAGSAHNLVLCSDGTLAAWGSGPLGTSGTSGSLVPVAVNTSGVLAGKTVVAIAAGNSHSLVLCSDGTVVAWGSNFRGQLGNNSTADSALPVAVSTSGVLSGKKVVAISANYMDSLALCSDGTLVAWGSGVTGGLGSGSGADSLVPVAVSTSSFQAGERFVATVSGPVSLHRFGFVASAPVPVIDAPRAVTITRTSAAITGTINPKGNRTTAQVEYGLTSSYGSTVAATLSPDDGLNPQPVNVNLVGLTPGRIYHYRFTATNAFGTSVTKEGTFATSINVGATFNSAADVPVTASDFSAAGEIFSATLNFAPPPGTNLMVIRNTGPAFIHGRFSNLDHGQIVMLNYGGVSYPFVADYYGGSGNDLVLHWATSRPVAWGDNQSGELGDNSFITRPIPVALSGVLAGKTVLSSAGGRDQSVARCSDGTVAVWGNNSPVPKALNPLGALAGKTVIAVAAGESHCLALCSDGTVAAWGSNNGGALGNNYSTSASDVPVAVNTDGVLSGKTVVAIAAGRDFSLALCSDGTVVGWGANYEGQLGCDSTVGVPVPVAVHTGGVLSGKKVVAIAAGSVHSVALCSDGTMAVWGQAEAGQLGNNVTDQAETLVPVAVATDGVLAGKTVVAIAAGNAHNLALCSDGTLVAWGANYNGQLGDNSTTLLSFVPVAVNRGGLLSGRTVVAIAAGDSHSMALCSDGTLAAWGSNNYGQLGNNGTTSSSVPVAVDKGLLAGGDRYMAMFSGSIAAHNFAVVASPLLPIVTSLPIIDLNSNSVTLRGTVNPFGSATTVVFEYGTDTSYGNNRVVTLSPNDDFGVQNVSATLTGLPSGTTYHYRLKATNLIGTTSTADGTFTIGTDIDAKFSSPNFVPLTVGSFSALGGKFSVALDFAPAIGTNLMVVRNTGREFINGTFGTLAQGQEVTLRFNGIDYHFLANYFGGDGNDLVLEWASTRALSWGANLSGQNGNNSTSGRLVPGAVTSTGVLSGKSITHGAAGLNHSLAVCLDGTLLSWGDNTYGQLGLVLFGALSSKVPVAVNTTGVLAGKKVVRVAAGERHSLALCSDGTIASFGSNSVGQLGNGTFNNSNMPMAVSTAGVLANKKVIAVAAGSFHSLALCSDGTLAAWGANNSGQLGNGTTTTSKVPVEVSTGGALSGKTVVAVAAGSSYSLALCSDGTLAAWGANDSGQLGNGSTATSNVPVAVDLTGVLSGKSVVSIAAGSSHSLALCADGTFAAWGLNTYGQLGNATTDSSSAPVAVSTAGVLSGKTVVTIAAGSAHSLALCSDGTIAGWGRNSSGQLGNGSTTVSNILPVVAQNPATVGERYSAIFSGPLASHNLGASAIPLSPAVVTLPVTNLFSGSVSLNGTVNALSGSAAVTFEYGLTPSYGSSITAKNTPVTGSADTAVSVDLANLAPNTTFYYRVRATNAGGTTIGTGLMFTTPESVEPSVAVGPTGGTMTLTPGSSVIPNASLKVTFAGWTTSRLPITYSVFLNGVAVSSLGSSASYEFKAPSSVGTHTLTGRIYDAHGNFTEVTKSFTVNTAIESWRTTYFSTTQSEGVAADLADPDGDGMSNVDEYVAGLIPTNSASRFNVRLENLNGRPAIIFGPVFPGRSYAVKYKANLNDTTWMPLTDIETRDNQSERTIIDVSPGNEVGFYTVEITLPY